MSGNPLHGPRMSAHPRPMRWPDAIAGARRVVGPLDYCADCPPEARLWDRMTWARYGGQTLCLKHALRRAEGR